MTIKAQAFLLAAEDDDGDFDVAHRAVIDVAKRGGASRLDVPLKRQLASWIKKELVQEIALARVRCEAKRRELAAAEQDDPVRYWRDLIAESDQHNQRAMTGIALALCETYRRWWGAQQGPSLEQRRAARGLAT